MDAVFPVPFAVDGDDALRVRLRPRRGERHGLVGLRARPHQRRAEDVVVGRVGRAVFAVFGLRLAAHPPVRPGPIADPTVAGGVAEERRLEADDPVRLEIERLHRGDRAVRFLLDAERPRQQMEVDVLLVLDDAHAPPVAQLDVRVAVHEIAAKLAHDRMLRFASAVDADFAGRVAAQDGPVLHERDREPAPRRRDRRARPRHPAADDDKISLHRLCDRRVSDAQCAFGRDAPACVRTGYEHEPRAAPVKARQVFKRDRRPASGDFHDAAVLPRPLAGTRAKLFLKRFPVHAHAKTPGRAIGPVARPDPDAVVAVRGERDTRLGIRHTHAHAVRQKIRRAHDIHELRVKNPSARVETLRIDDHRLAGSRTERRTAGRFA